MQQGLTTLNMATLQAVDFLSTLQDPNMFTFALRAPSVRRIQPADWAPLRSEITRLYAEENKTLKDVQAIIEARYRLRATPENVEDEIKVVVR